ncbi:MAG: hypothetical protein ACYC3L_07150 [Gemmatimonadaceae bacterium]
MPIRSRFRPFYRTLLSEESRARLRPLAYPLDSLFRLALWRAAEGKVHSGPFAGLALAPHPLLPHLLGTYERELHAVINALCARPWRRIVNVGGGNGFYIAGFGRRVADAALIVFELDPEAREVIARTMERNGLSARTQLLGAADAAGLDAACRGTGHTLVVMDVEGAELELANLEQVPSLRHATILVETHDILRAGCRDSIVSQFASTHMVRSIPAVPRTLDDFPPTLAPVLRSLAPSRCRAAVQESRGGAQDWLVLEPRTA